MHLIAIDWRALFVPTVSLVEMVIRGSAIYLLVFAMMRFFRRESGAPSTADLLVMVLVADAAQNAMASEYHSLTEGAVLVGTIFAWNYGLDWLGYRFPWMHRVLNPSPLLLVKNGRLLVRNLRAEMLTRADLAEQLREQGIADFAEVGRCYLESDGHLSVIRRTGKPHPVKEEGRTK